MMRVSFFLFYSPCGNGLELGACKWYVWTNSHPFANTDTKEEDLTHPEDIEHFRKHDEQEAAAEHQEQMDRMPIVEQNIPQKFRRY